MKGVRRRVQNPERVEVFEEEVEEGERSDEEVDDRPVTALVKMTFKLLSQGLGVIIRSPVY
jgi:hypothetical protein